MYPVRILSLNNGWEILTTQKQTQWVEIQHALELINQDAIKKPSKILMAEGLVSGGFDDRYNAVALESIFPLFLKRTKWRSVASLGHIKHHSIKSGVIKNKVVAGFTATLENANYLERIIYIDAPRNTIAKNYAVTVLVVVDKSFKKILNNERESAYTMPFFEHECRGLLNELQPIESSAPIVFVFCSLKRQRLTVSSLTSNKIPAIDRAIEFPPEFYQAGVTVLSNFGTVLRQKYPDIKAPVRIEQKGNTVRIHIELPNGEVKIIEEALEHYLQIVQDKEPASTLLDNPLQVMMLENKLELVKAELRTTVNAYQLALRFNDDTAVRNEQAVANFQRIIGEQAGQLEQKDKQIERQDKQLEQQSSHISSLISLSAQQNLSHERIQLAQISHTSTLFKDLLGEAHGSQAAVEAVHTLWHHLTSSIAAIDAEDQIKAALSTLKEEKPSLLNHLAGQLESAGFGALGGVALQWIVDHSPFKG
jgi:hypothetical protein